MAAVLGIAGLFVFIMIDPFLPGGLLWVILPKLGFALALLGAAVGTAVALIIALFATLSVGTAFGVMTLALWIVVLLRLYPQLIGVEKYFHVVQGESYILSFEQPRFLLDEFGTREWVIYNPRDEHQVYSHTSWLLPPPEFQEPTQGWYESGETGVAHGKYFWFDSSGFRPFEPALPFLTCLHPTKRTRTSLFLLHDPPCRYP